MTFGRSSCQLKQELRSFCATGHSGFGIKGTDIVCAAFTCLVRTVLRFGVSSGWIFSHKICDSLVSFEIEESVSCQEIDSIMSFLLLGIEDLQKEFPKSLSLEIRKLG